MIAILGVALVIGLSGPAQVNYYAITPGDAQSVAPFISVPSKLDHSLQGRILLTDVFLVGPLNTDSYRSDKANPDYAVVPTAEILGTTPPEQYQDESYLDMAASQSDATASALIRLGYTVQARNAGVQVYQTFPGTPAAGALKVGQVITKVNNVATPTVCDLLHALVGLHPGSAAALDVEQSSIDGQGTVVAGRTVPETIKLGKRPHEPAITGCGTPFTPTAALGVAPMQQIDWSFPIRVSVHTANIGGPSAGLAMALGIIDKLTGGHLTGNHTVAVTGTIDAEGNVGPIGGAPQKAIAAREAGATVFLVPTLNYAAAKAKATSHFHVYAVANLDQALFIMKALGGTIPANHVQAQAAP
jgi:PDZ domain-containing protein